MEMINLGKKVKQIGVGLGLLACVGINSCQTITQTNTKYGTPIPKEEIIEGDKIINKYLITNFRGSKDILDIQISKQDMRVDKVIKYDEIPGVIEEYTIKKRIKPLWAVIGTGMYGVASAALPWIPALDVVAILIMRPENTMYNKFLMKWSSDEKSAYAYYTDESSKKVISVTPITKREDKLTTQTHTPINLYFASNIPVKIHTEKSVLQNKVNELRKNTDSNGRVIFQITGEPGQIKIETIAQDGKNDVEIIN
jgi:hypothetical protein